MSRRRRCPTLGFPKRVWGLSGVRGSARVHGLVRNRRDPSAWPTSGKDRCDKPMVKRSGGQRESDGVVVPLRAGGQHNPRSGKGPDFGHASGAGTRKGMAGTARPNEPDRRSSVVDLNGLAPVRDNPTCHS